MKIQGSPLQMCIFQKKEKEIGEVFENGHFKNVQNKKHASRNFLKK